MHNRDKSKDALSQWFSRWVPWSSWLVLLVGLTLSVLAALHVKGHVDHRAEREFDEHCAGMTAAITERLDDHSRILRSAAAFFDASEEVTRDEWGVYAQLLYMDKQLPGMQGLGFSVLIPPSELMAHINKIRGEGFPDYTVWPPGDREIYSAVIYLEPFDFRNQRAFGYDMLSEPVRRAAMERARDEDEAVLSGKVLLVQETGEDVQAGALMYVPVYRRGMPVDSVERRRAAMYGWVYSPYRMNDLINGILGSHRREIDPQYVLQVFDGSEASPGSLLYEDDSEPNIKEHFVRLIPLDFNGHRWMLRFSQIDAGVFIVDYESCWLVLFGGTLISFLLFIYVRSLHGTRMRAEGLARELAADLGESETRFRTMVENLTEAVFSLRSDGTVEYVSPAIEAILGYRPEELIGQVYTAFFHPEDAARAEATFAEVLDGKRTNQEYRMVARDGEIRQVRVSTPPVQQTQDGSVLVQGVLADITVYKQAKDKLIESEERFARAFDSNPLLMSISDADTGEYIEVNETFTSVTGYTRNETIGKTSLDIGFISASARQAMIKVLNEQGRVNGLELSLIKKSGETLICEYYGEIIQVSGKDRLLSIALDITERKLAELALVNLSSQNSLILASAAEGILGLDLKGRHTFVNPAAAQMLGWTVDELLGCASHLVWHHTRPDGSPFPEEECEIYQVSRDGKTRQVIDGLFWRKDGTSFSVDYTGTPIYEQDQLAGVVVTFTNITKRKQAEKRIHDLAQHLESIREEERKRLSRELHDDIGQILTALKIDLIMLEDSCVCESVVKDRMGDMKNLLSGGIQSVHSLCRRLRPGALDDLTLGDALAGLVDDWKQRNEVVCEFCADMDDEALSDEIRTAVFRMVQEALTNVSRYAEAARVDVSLVADEKGLNVSVDDDGKGMEIGSADKPTSFGLLGMRERIEGLGGELTIESIPGKGTRIEASIPLENHTEKAE